jgi:N-acetylmuramoyl-L-alanine amidase CwlA
MRAVSRIILHWLGEGDSRNYVSQSAVDGIREYHTKINGWSDIGYHWLIDRNGVLYEGRPEDIVGAHAYGANEGSIGINLMYGTKDNSISNETIVALVKKIKEICIKYHIIPSKYTIIGHRDVMATECPGVVYGYIPSIIAMASGNKVDQTRSPMENPPETKEISRVAINYEGKSYEGIMVNNQSFVSIGTLSKMMKLGVKWIGETKTVELKKL